MLFAAKSSPPPTAKTLSRSQSQSVADTETSFDVRIHVAVVAWSLAHRKPDQVPLCHFLRGAIILIVFGVAFGACFTRVQLQYTLTTRATSRYTILLLEVLLYLIYIRDLAAYLHPLLRPLCTQLAQSAFVVRARGRHLGKTNTTH